MDGIEGKEEKELGKNIIQKKKKQDGFYFNFQIKRGQILNRNSKTLEIKEKKQTSCTHAANRPIKSIQLAIEKVPPSSVLRFMTTC